MVTILYAGVCLCVCLLIFHLKTKKYLNPYSLIFVFAKKGQGKSTYLTKQALIHLKRGWTVFSTEPIPGTYKIDYLDIGYCEFPQRSLVLIDEVGMIWDNRNFKNFDNAVRDWFKLQRHRKVKVILASQSFDVDKKIRDLADEMFLLVKRFRVFSYGKRILKRLDIVEATGQSGSESRVVDQLKFDSLLFFFLGSRTLTYIPKYAPYFDSFAAPALAEKTFPLTPDREIPTNSRKALRALRRAFRRK